MSSTDDDDLAGVKDWWNRNGKPLLTGALLAGVVVLGWNTWHKYQNNQSQDATLGEIARQRLARVLAAQNKAEDALKLLDGDAEKAFLASREELKGDLLVQLGRADDAHGAYEKAKAALSDEAAVGGLQLKLDDLARGDA